MEGRSTLPVPPTSLSPFNSDPDIRHKVVGISLQRREMEMKVEFVTQERWECSGR